ncbi:MAG: hypothetical protein ACI9TI_002191 [Natronomonas sp.]|jgi:hypothetical protein|uniref:Nmad3 family putative nucleotide modification protein n=1 Tax=Natronomonas sp. TaxID=2184060 RepID=UPI0039894549
MRGIAINVGANTNEPGFRGPIDTDGRFEYVPIPESEPTRPDVDVPTYKQLDLQIDVSQVADTAVHLDPTFAGVHGSSAYTYGDPHGVKAGPLSELEAGDFVFFYATLSTATDEPPEWVAPRWGAYVIGHFRLATDPVTVETPTELTPTEREHFANNAHLKRDPFDAKVLLYGDPDGSALYDVAVPLSSREAGVDANCLVTGLSSDSGKGPWWRRPMQFDERGTETLLELERTGNRDRPFE